MDNFAVNTTLFQVIFFYSTFRDDVSVVLELVEGDDLQRSNLNYRTAGWTMVPISQNILSTSDYSNSMREVFVSK